MQAAALRTTVRKTAPPENDPLTTVQIASLETNNANLRSENASLLLNADPSLVSNLRIEHARLTASEGLLRSKLEELESKQATLVQTTAASTFQNCQEGFKRELALKSVCPIHLILILSHRITRCTERVEAREQQARRVQQEVTEGVDRACHRQVSPLLPRKDLNKY
jgi:hypothetical protein